MSEIIMDSAGSIIQTFGEAFEPVLCSLSIEDLEEVLLIEENVYASLVAWQFC